MKKKCELCGKTFKKNKKNSRVFIGGVKYKRVEGNNDNNC